MLLSFIAIKKALHAFGKGSVKIPNLL